MLLEKKYIENISIIVKYKHTNDLVWNATRFNLFQLIYV